MTNMEAAAALDAITGDNPEEDHGAADDVLLAALPPVVRDAYSRLIERADWWPHA